MATITIRTTDTSLNEVLKRESLSRGESINKLILEALQEKFMPASSRRRFTDLDHLAGTWTEEEYLEFTRAVADLQTVSPEDWQ